MTEKEASAGRTNEPTAYRSAKPQGGEAKKKRAKTDNQLFIMALAGAVFLFVFFVSSDDGNFACVSRCGQRDRCIRRDFSLGMGGQARF